LVNCQHFSAFEIILFAPFVNPFFRPEEQHRRSGVDDVLPPARGRHREVDDTWLGNGLAIQDLERQKLEFPVICGGAALTRKYVEDDLRREYSNAVFYADDAFGGLHIQEGRTVKEYAKAVAVDEETGPVFAERSAVVSDAPNIPTPPFWGVRVKKDYDLSELFPYINETALFKNQWQLKTASQEDYARLVEQKFRPLKKELENEIIASGWFEPKVVWGYFPAQGDGNDVVVYEIPPAHRTGEDARVSTELLRFTFPRQREGRRLCISDFFARRLPARWM